MKVLLTVATGFIRSSLIKNSKDFNVRIVTRSDSGLYNDVFKIDMLDGNTNW